MLETKKIDRDFMQSVKENNMTWDYHRFLFDILRDVPGGVQRQILCDIS
jgi:hypothetical protein